MYNLYMIIVQLYSNCHPNSLKENLLLSLTVSSLLKGELLLDESTERQSTRDDPLKVSSR